MLQEGKADIVGMARQLLADPDWVRKVEDARSDQILRCIYCNVCKALDENFKEVHCFLWPKGARQAPPDRPDAAGPDWGGGADLGAELRDGQVRLSWNRAQGEVTGYDVYRAEAPGEAVCVEAVKSAKFADRNVLGGLRYHYYVRAYDAAGRASAPSNVVQVDMPLPDFVPAAGRAPALSKVD